ncbi:MAG: hypothetical protein AAFV85_18590 [Cyanobacteria bacterium J06634_6]
MSTRLQPNAEIADQYLGNINEDRDLVSQIALDRKQQNCLDISIERKDCCKGRIFATADLTASDSEAPDLEQPVGIIKGRDWTLRDGDVLLTQSQKRVLIHIKQQQVIALQFDRKAYNSPVKLMHLGHVMGNQHWPISLQGETLYVEVAADVERIESAIQEIAESLDIKGLHVVRELKDAHEAVAFSHSHVHVH